MSQKKKFDPEQIWFMLFLLPGIILGQIANINESGLDAAINAGLYGGISAAIGLGFYSLVKKQIIAVKAISLAGLYFVTFFGAIILNDSLENDKQIISKPWKVQSFGAFSFESPENLKHLDFKLSEDLKVFYKYLDSYSDENLKRLTNYFKGEILIDSIDFYGAFEGSFSDMLTEVNIDLNNVHLDYIEESRNFLSAISVIEKGQDTIYGYGCMYFDYPKLESVWLIPRRKGFSVEYIEKFQSSIKFE